MWRLFVVLMIGIVGFTTLFIWSCNMSTQMAKFDSIGADHIVKVYSGGQVVAEYLSSGKPESPQSSDGYRFMNKDTGKLVEVSGTVTMESK